MRTLDLTNATARVAAFEAITDRLSVSVTRAAALARLALDAAEIDGNSAALANLERRYSAAIQRVGEARAKATANA